MKLIQIGNQYINIDKIVFISEMHLGGTVIYHGATDTGFSQFPDVSVDSVLATLQKHGVLTTLAKVGE